MQGNLGGSFYRELSWLGQPHLYSAAGFQPCASFGRCCWRGRGGFTGKCHRWDVTFMGWYAVRWYFLWLVDLMLFLHSVFLMAMMMIMMLQLFGPWRVLTIFCHSLTVFEDQLQDVKKMLKASTVKNRTSGGKVCLRKHHLRPKAWQILSLPILNSCSLFDVFDILTYPGRLWCSMVFSSLLISFSNIYSSWLL